MKNFKLLIVVLCFSCSLFAISVANADSNRDNREYNSDDKGRNDANGISDEKTPVNNQVLFLIIVGTAIGCKVIMDKNKQAKSPAVQITSKDRRY